jgi:hypothetical protein
VKVGFRWFYNPVAQGCLFQAALVASNFYWKGKYCVVSIRMFFSRDSCVFAVDKHKGAKCRLVSNGWGQPSFFPHRSFRSEQKEPSLESRLPVSEKSFCTDERIGVENIYSCCVGENQLNVNRKFGLYVSSKHWD